MTDYDDSTAFLGPWGRFQQIIFLLLCACIMPNGTISFCIVFLADIPDHHCLIPEVNLTQDWHNASIPKEVIKSINRTSWHGGWVIKWKEISCMRTVLLYIFISYW